MTRTPVTTPTPTPTDATYAAEVARLLWPAPWGEPVVTRERHRDGTRNRDAYLFPGARRPRLLVPADLPGSSRMLQRLGSGLPAVVGPARQLLERAVRSPGFALARWPVLRIPATEPGADSIERHLSGCLGTDVRVGVLLGTRRVNQKPVLLAFDPAGELLGYVKIGHNDLTSALVRSEATALAAIAGRPSGFEVPRVLHHGRWAGLEVLAISPLATDPRAGVTPAARRAAELEVVGLAGTTTAALAASSYWDRLGRTVAALGDVPGAERLRASVANLAHHHGDVEVALGGWHGDWGHWNMGRGDGVLRVWDWERYDPEVPVGFDGLHYAAQSVRPGARQEQRQEAAFLGSVAAVQNAYGVPAEQHRLVLRLYLLEIAVRYVDALTHGSTPALLRRTAWVQSLQERLAEHPLPLPSKGRP